MQGCVWLTGNRTLATYDDRKRSARVVDHEHSCGDTENLRLRLYDNAISGEIEISDDEE